MKDGEDNQRHDAGRDCVGIAVSCLPSYLGRPRELEGGRERGEKCVPGRRNLSHGQEARPSVSVSCLSSTPLTHELSPTIKCGKQHRTVLVQYFGPTCATLPAGSRMRDRTHACQKWKDD